jgi:hypothetical protein
MRNRIKIILGFLVSRFFLVIKTKPHAREIAWLRSKSGIGPLAPFGGITRIRFKGSRSPAVAGLDSQPWRLPRTFENVQW